MKRVLALIIALLMMMGMAAFAEDMDLTTFTDEELNGLEIAIAKEREARANAETEAETAETAAVEEEAEAPAAEEEPAEFQPIAQGVWSDYTRTLQEKLKDLGFLNGKADGIFGPKTEEALKALQEAMGTEPTGVVNAQEELDAILALQAGDGVNLAVDTSDEWSEWMTPEYNSENKTFFFGYAYLGDKNVGDYYNCQFEVEFSGVAATEGKEFKFFTLGPVDDSWEVSNIWNKRFVRLVEVPEDGVYRFTKAIPISEDNVNSEQFKLGCRCDYWANGSFRIRRIKVEKGSYATEWTPAP